MHYHKEGYPEENDLVLCTVTSVQYNSVFCKLDEYDKSGMIHISEVAPGRIRNIRDYVVEGKKVVCKVLRINEERGHIDLSLRRVAEAVRREKNALVKQELKAEKIIEQLASELKEEPSKAYDAIARPILEQYEYVHMAFQEHVDGESDLAELGIPERYVKHLIERVNEKIKPKRVAMGGTLKLSTFAEDGVEAIKGALRAAKAIDTSVTISYLGSGSYKLSVEADEPKEAEELLERAVTAAKSIIEKSDGGTASFAK